MIRLQVRTYAGRYLWRLLGDNNRTMAISSSTFDDQDECLKNMREAMRLVQTREPEARELGSNKWGWVLPGLDGNDLVNSLTTFSRRSECVKAIDRFLAIVRSPRTAS